MLKNMLQYKIFKFKIIQLQKEEISIMKQDLKLLTSIQIKNI